jgi:hypothetical protein
MTDMAKATLVARANRRRLPMTRLRWVGVDQAGTRRVPANRGEAVG